MIRRGPLSCQKKQGHAVREWKLETQEEKGMKY
jgi:hypothetical protein